MHSAKRLNTIKPAKRTSANSIWLSLLVSQRALNTILNTKVYTNNINKGLKNAQRMPMTDPR